MQNWESYAETLELSSRNSRTKYKGEKMNSLGLKL